MTQPIELDQVAHLIRHYRGRLKRYRSDKPSLRRTTLERTIQVLEHYRDLCTIIDQPKESQD
ncbi:hypothetical protein ES703_104772 [subsurface metagenome]